MKTSEMRCNGLHELDAVAQNILNTYSDKRIVALSGPMGAGKTTFIQAFCRQLKVTDVVNSPTFSIVNEYLTENGESVYHFDLYRLKKPEELLDIGYEDYFYSGNWCFVEWPEMAASLIPDSALHIKISVPAHSETRLFTIGRFTD